ncbi:MAG TPA: LuxR C-terminal-related transcriptional regulator, partial [Acidimicrobiales bacterium]|nr:LuxR C-terminal-related transcriptional regulator [Acidimicrobiales bacterium]
VLLDNCEHVLDAAAALARHVVTACPEVSVLTTSRAPLGVPGERRWNVPRLDLVAAVQLFTDRARSVSGGPAPGPDGYGGSEGSDEAVVAEICSRLDGLPLAVELTAAWSRVLSPGQILDRLTEGARELTAPGRGREPRHDTMAAAVEWSYRLVPAGAQRVFERASVFAGGFDLEALEAVAGRDDPDDDVLVWLAELVDNSLVLTERVPGGPMRYRMLEPVRQHADARLARSGEGDEVRRRHLDHYLDLAARYDPWQDLGGRAIRLEQLARDEGNLLAAWEWARRQRSDVGLRLGVACGQYFAYGGRVNEGLRWFEEALAADTGQGTGQGTEDGRLRADALLAVGQLAWRSGDYDLAHARLEDALALAASLADPVFHGRVLRILSAAEFSVGHTAVAAEQAEQAIDIYRACGDGVGTAGALISRAWARYAQGDVDGGNDDMRAALAANEPFANVTVTAYGHFGLTYGAALASDTEAQHRHLAAARVAIDAGGIVERADWLAQSAVLAAQQGRPHPAVRLLGGMDTWGRRRGGSRMPAQLGALFTPVIERLFLEVGSPLGDRLWARGRQMPWAELVADALARPPDRSPLTRRETEIAGLVAEGLTNVDIAKKLVLSRRTVESHIDHIRQKLTLGSRNEIIVWVLQESQQAQQPRET